MSSPLQRYCWCFVQSGFLEEHPLYHCPKTARRQALVVPSQRQVPSSRRRLKEMFGGMSTFQSYSKNQPTRSDPVAPATDDISISACRLSLPRKALHLSNGNGGDGDDRMPLTLYLNGKIDARIVLMYHVYPTRYLGALIVSCAADTLPNRHIAARPAL